MACMEYACTECPWHELSNVMHRQCPECGSRITKWFDEPENYETETEGI
jgi:predicted  nucleic acid-binding Zn-ribbon protein